MPFARLLVGGSHCVLWQWSEGTLPIGSRGFDFLVVDIRTYMLSRKCILPKLQAIGMMGHRGWVPDLRLWYNRCREDFIIFLLLASGYLVPQVFPSLLALMEWPMLFPSTLFFLSFLSSSPANDSVVTSLRRSRRSAPCGVALRLASTLLRHYCVLIGFATEASWPCLPNKQNQY